MIGFADPITNGHAERLDATFAEGSGPERRRDWLVIFGHGVTGDKERPVIADTARALEEAGFDTLRFSFAGNGASEGDFREATVTKEIGDLQAILAAAKRQYSKICYIGHSMGAAVGVLVAARDPRINCFVSLAGMVDTRAFAEREFGQETPDQGVMWEDPACPLSSAFMEDLCRTIKTVEPAAKAVAIPWLLVHGTADDVVPPQDSRSIKDLKGDAVELVLIEGADHSFNQPEHKRHLTDRVVGWLEQHVSPAVSP